MQVSAVQTEPDFESRADAILLRPLPVVGPSEVLDISNARPDNPYEAISYPDYLDIREASYSFSGLISYGMAPLPAVRRQQRSQTE